MQEHGNQYESLRGGDTYYRKDVELVQTAINTLLANRVGTTALPDEDTYWLASRNYGKESNFYYYLNGYMVSF